MSIASSKNIKFKINILIGVKAVDIYKLKYYNQLAIYLGEYYGEDFVLFVVSSYRRVDAF